MYFLFFARFSPMTGTASTFNGLPLPHEPRLASVSLTNKSKEKIFGNRWLQARLCPFKATQLASVKGWISACNFSVQVVVITATT